MENKKRNEEERNMWQEAVIGGLDALSKFTASASKKLAEIKEDYENREVDPRTGAEKATDFTANVWASTILTYEEITNKAKDGANNVAQKKDEILAEKRREKAVKKTEEKNEEFIKELRRIKEELKEELKNLENLSKDE